MSGAKKARPALSPSNPGYSWDDLVTLTGIDRLGDVRHDSRGRPFVYVADETVNLVDTDSKHFGHDEEKRTVRERRTVRARLNPNGTITMVTEVGTKETGVTRRGGDGQPRRWWRWRSSIAYAMTARPDGTWLKLVPGKGTFFSFVLTAESAWEAHETLLEALPEPEPSLTTYPVLGHYFEPVKARQGMHGNHRGSADDPMWTSRVRRAASGAADAREFTAALFGKTRVRKDLVKAVASADLSRICMAESFRGLVPIDWIVTYLRRGAVKTRHDRRAQTDTKSANIYVDARPVLRRLDEHSLRGLLRDEDPGPRNVMDIVEMHVKDYDSSAPLPRCHTWEEVHQALVTRTNLYGHLNRGKGDSDPVKHTDEALAIESSFTTGGRSYEIVVAHHEDDLYAWGQAMNHCIATYGQRMRSRHNLYGAVYCDKRLVGNFEITGYNPSIREGARPSQPVLTQLLGHSNSMLPDEIRGAVLEHFVARGVDVVRYWGQDGAELEHAVAGMPQNPAAIAVPVPAGGLAGVLAQPEFAA